MITVHNHVQCVRDTTVVFPVKNKFQWLLRLFVHHCIVTPLGALRRPSSDNRSTVIANNNNYLTLVSVRSRFKCRLHSQIVCRLCVCPLLFVSLQYFFCFAFARYTRGSLRRTAVSAFIFISDR